MSKLYEVCSEDSVRAFKEDEKSSIHRIPEGIVKIHIKYQEESSDMFYQPQTRFLNMVNNFKRIVCPSTLEELGDSSFKETKIEHIEFNEGLRVIGERCFQKCYKMSDKELKTPKSLEVIKDFAFNATKNEIIHLNNRLKSVGKEAIGGTSTKIVIISSDTENIDPEFINTAINPLSLTLCITNYKGQDLSKNFFNTFKHFPAYSYAHFWDFALYTKFPKFIEIIEIYEGEYRCQKPFFRFKTKAFKMQGINDTIKKLYKEEKARREQAAAR